MTQPMTTTMEFGIKTPPQQCTFQEMLDIWRAVDKLPIFSSAWNFDHFYPLVGDPAGPNLEAWVTLAALARETKRIRIGCMVNGTPYRHPAVLANMAASLDIVCDGRLELGLGAGWHQDECAAYGIPLLPMKQRMDRFEEYVEVVIRLLENTTTVHTGEYFQLDNARCEPKGPQQPRPPIVVGGGGERRTLKVVAKFADHWNLPFATPAQFTAKKAILAEHCERVGRKLADIRCSVQIALPADQSPSESTDQAAALAAVGVDCVIFSLRNPYRTAIIEPLAQALEQIHSE